MLTRSLRVVLLVLLILLGLFICLQWTSSLTVIDEFFGTRTNDTRTSHQEDLPSLPERIITIWEGSDLPQLQARFLEVLLCVNSPVEVWLYSNTVRITTLLKYEVLKRAITADPPKLSIVRFTLEDMAFNTGALEWVLSLNNTFSWHDRLFRVAAADFLRYAALYKHGGLYLDMDILALKPFTGGWSQNSIVVDSLLPYNCFSALEKNNITFTCMCNCMLSFRRGSLLMERALKRLPQSYDPRNYITFGAPLLLHLIADAYNPNISMRFNQSVVLKTGLDQVVDNKFAQCWHIKNIRNATKASVDAILQEDCWAYHVFLAGHSKEIEQGSMVDLLVEHQKAKFCKSYLLGPEGTNSTTTNSTITNSTTTVPITQKPS